MKIKIIDEPLLEFGNDKHICPKTGIETMGVYDTHDKLRQTDLRLGIVGRGEGIDLMDVWLDECENGIEARESRHPNLFRGFGGFNKQYGFFSNLLYDSSVTRAIQKTELTKAIKLPSREERIQACVELYYDQIRFLSENRSVDVILCVIPNEMFEEVTKRHAEGEDEDADTEETKLEHNFRRMLKARSMHLRVPLQLVLESNLITGKSTRAQKGQQDDATRAWNFCTALYYKGNKTIPWRLVEESHKPRTCYVGVGFYRSRDASTISTSLAQVFDEFGHGLILRGTPVAMDKDDRRPFMNSDQAYELLLSALNEYDHALKQMPARVVIHKTSNFKPSEIEGFTAALQEKNIRMKDYVTILDSRIKLYSYEAYPPPRGTLLTLSEDAGVLYTRGYINYYKTYPGMYVPSPLEIRLFEHDSSLEDVCEEILGLSKMNWNNTQLDGKLPITLECAKRVGDILKYVDKHEQPQSRYSFYM